MFIKYPLCTWYYIGDMKNEAVSDLQIYLVKGHLYHNNTIFKYWNQGIHKVEVIIVDKSAEEWFPEKNQGMR